MNSRERAIYAQLGISTEDEKKATARKKRASKKAAPKRRASKKAPPSPKKAAVAARAPSTQSKCRKCSATSGHQILYTSSGAKIPCPSGTRNQHDPGPPKGWKPRRPEAAAPAKAAPAPKKAKRKQRPKVGKAPTERKTRAVPLQEVRAIFTDDQLDFMADTARAALRDVRLGKSDEQWCDINIPGVVSYRIRADEKTLQDFIWRIGEQEHVASNPSGIPLVRRRGRYYYQPSWEAA